MSNTNGWTQDDWRTFYELKTKANLWNLEAGSTIFADEIPARAQSMIVRAYHDVPENYFDEDDF